MPNITVKMYPGKTEEQKKALAEKLAQDIMEANGVPAGAVSVVIQEVAPDDWKDEVISKDLANRDLIYKMPGYPID